MKEILGFVGFVASNWFFIIGILFIIYVILWCKDGCPSGSRLGLHKWKFDRVSGSFGACTFYCEKCHNSKEEFKSNQEIIWLREDQENDKDYIEEMKSRQEWLTKRNMNKDEEN